MCLESPRMPGNFATDVTYGDNTRLDAPLLMPVKSAWPSGIGWKASLSSKLGSMPLS